ncbi:uncharacterized protein LOC125179394 [Hyalella azteca]|uniref:Uncharacterized protein LOC125179394 n=1 Tax=Hyalella azteca TaxID=294128 RepID=A0A979FXF2_HYAAZ|nr:uncharacterized protein LOC125179394 [Hyalella azteca]
MPSYVQDLLDQKKLAEAVAYVQSDAVGYRTIENLADEDDNVVTYGQLLSIKRPKESSRKLLTKGSNAISYDRLLLFRELVSGDLFYVVCRKQSQTNSALWAIHDIYIGSYLCFYEPCLGDEIHGVKIVECSTNPIPILPSAQYQRIQDLVPALEESTHIQGFFLEVEKIVLKKVVTHRACPSRTCDSCHIPDDPCPAQVGGRTSNTCIKAKVYIAELEAANCGQKFISYTSQSLANLFIHPDSLQLARINSIRLREAIDRILQLYMGEGVRFLISGWYKRRYLPDGSPSNSCKLHLSRIQPRRFLNVALYREVQNNPVAPHIAAPAHAVRRVNDFMGGEDNVEQEDCARNPHRSPSPASIQEGEDEDEEVPSGSRPSKRSRNTMS